MEVDNLERRQETELSLHDLLVTFRKRRRVVFSTTLVVCILCAVYCAISTRRYEATGIMQIQKESSGGLGLDSLMGGTGGASGSIEGDLDTNLETQARILHSNTLALKTIENLHMEETADFQPHWSLVGWVLHFFSPKATPDAPGLRLEDSPQRRNHVLSIFSHNLTVKVIPGTRLIELDYLNPDPKLAAAVVSELMQQLADYTFQTKYNATSQASSWLTGQLTELRKQSETLQGQVVASERESGVYSLGTVDAQGHEQAYSGVLDQLQQATQALALARQNRILKGAIARAAETGDAELISGLSGNTTVGGASMNNSLALVQTLRQQEATQQAVVREALTKYGPSFPRLTELRANLAALESSVKDEVRRIQQRAESDYAIAKEDEERTQAQYDDAKTRADKMNNKAIEYMIVRQEAAESRELYEDLLKRLKEAGVLEGLKASNITVVDPGRTPASPKKPNVPLYMLGALGGGFFLGCLGALLVDALDNKIGSVLEVEELTGQAVLGVTPLVDHSARQAAGGRRTQMLTVEDPQSTFAEALRSVRTAILLTGGGEHSRVILVTSSIPSEGKTMISTNLAVVLAQSNRRVLLVDLDMRRGRLYALMGQPPNSTGLSNLLAGQQQEILASPIDSLPRLDVLLSGTPPPNPSELIDSKFNHFVSVWREKYDYIILDGPPLLPVTDALIVNPLVDITVLLARVGLTERAQLQRSYRLLTKETQHFVGVVVNGLSPKDDSYYHYYGYHTYSSHYGKDGNAEPK